MITPQYYDLNEAFLSINQNQNQNGDTFVVSDCVSSIYTYVGCHKDNTQRDLPYNPMNATANNYLTPENCGAMCVGYLFFGLQV